MKSWMNLPSAASRLKRIKFAAPVDGDVVGYALKAAARIDHEGHAGVRAYVQTVIEARGADCAGAGALDRQIVANLGNRWCAVVASLEFASRDNHFRALVGAADKARDAHAWNRAEALYARALSLYPYHHGYCVQLAHMLKEQGRLADAELHYRTALALGGSPGDVREHLDFVCRVNGAHDTAALDAIGAFWLTVEPGTPAGSFPPTHFDLIAINAVIGGPVCIAAFDVLAQIRGAVSIAQLVAHLNERAQLAEGNLIARIVGAVAENSLRVGTVAS